MDSHEVMTLANAVLLLTLVIHFNPMESLSFESKLVILAVFLFLAAVSTKNLIKIVTTKEEEGK